MWTFFFFVFFPLLAAGAAGARSVNTDLRRALVTCLRCLELQNWAYASACLIQIIAPSLSLFCSQFDFQKRGASAYNYYIGILQLMVSQSILSIVANWKGCSLLIMIKFVDEESSWTAIQALDMSCNSKSLWCPWSSHNERTHISISV